LTEEILHERDIEVHIRSWQLLPGTGGIFEVTVNGDLIFSKKALGRHAEPGEVRQLILQKLDAMRSETST
jgi:selenoprotein W-related protein